MRTTLSTWSTGASGDNGNSGIIDRDFYAHRTVITDLHLIEDLLMLASRHPSNEPPMLTANRLEWQLVFNGCPYGSPGFRAYYLPSAATLPGSGQPPWLSITLSISRILWDVSCRAATTFV